MGVFFRALTVRTALLDPPDTSVTEIGLKAVFGPEDDTDTDRFTVPLNPLTLVKVMLEVPDELCAMLTEEGLAVIEKSGASLTATRTVVE
jgi:hypothetical protein